MARFRKSKTESPAGNPINCRARVADRALVSSRGSDDPRGMNWAWVGDRDRQPELGGDPLEVLVEAGERGDSPVDGLGGHGGFLHLAPELKDICDRDGEEMGGFLGPLDAEKRDEGKNVAAIRSLGV